jgi:cytochrome c551
MRNLPHIIASALCLALAFGAAVAEEKESRKHKRSNTTESTSTSSTTTTTTPPPATAAAFLSPAGEGRRAWLKYNCYGCHGMRAAGGMGPNIVHEGGEVGEAVREGEDEGMPSYGKLVSSTEITNLKAYLKSIGTANEPTFNDWWLPVPPK